MESKKRKVLVCDDMVINREILEDILSPEYEVLQAENGKQAVTIAYREGTELAAILLDLVMPEMDGFQVMEELHSNGLQEKIPIIVITGDDSSESEERCYSYGVGDFIHKPFNPILIKLRIRNLAELYSYKNNLENIVDKQTMALRNQYAKLREQARKLQESNERMIDVLGTVVESRNLESGLHIQRVKNYTKILAAQMMKDHKEYGITKHMIDVIVPASALHDVGKITIPDNILLKPGRLTPEEFECMKTHTLRGCDILDNMQGTWDQEYADVCHDICRYHHERYDGKGYPDGLSGDDIPVSAQIVSIADVYDALVHERVYKKAIPKDKAFEMIMNGECGTFSPKLLESFEKVRKQFEEEE